MKKRSWKDEDPHIGHDTAIIYTIYRDKTIPAATPEQAQLQGLRGFTVHMMQAGKEGDYHIHEDAEQIFYFTKGRGKMKIDDVLYDVKEGDAIHVPPPERHQVLNDSDDWLEHIVVTCPVRR